MALEQGIEEFARKLIQHVRDPTIQAIKNCVEIPNRQWQSVGEKRSGVLRRKRSQL
jgi:hypothetical protein